MRSITSRRLRLPAALVLALAILAAMVPPAVAIPPDYSISGTACVKGLVDPLGGYVLPYHHCLSIDASTSAAAPGTVTYTEGLRKPARVTLDCLVVEQVHGGHRVYASGPDVIGQRYYFTITDYGPAEFPSGYPWPSITTTTTPLGEPCGGHDGGTTALYGDYEVKSNSTETNELPKAAFTWSCEGLTCTLDAAPSSDSDGTVESYRWTIMKERGYEYLQGRQVTYTFAGPGNYAVILKVVDDDGASDGISEWISVEPGPTAEFTYTCTQLTCEFDATSSSDSDGQIVRYEWDFGDGTFGTGARVRHTFPAEGGYWPELTVYDDDGSSGWTTNRIEVSAFQLSAKRVTKGKQTSVSLSWSGARTQSVDVRRNGAVIATVANTGTYSDPLPVQPSPVTYQVCDSGSSRCSNEATIPG